MDKVQIIQGFSVPCIHHDIPIWYIMQIMQISFGISCKIFLARGGWMSDVVKTLFLAMKKAYFSFLISKYYF